MQQPIILMGEKNNDLTEIISQALNEMKSALGDKFNPDNINLAELERRTGISRAKLRRIKENGFVDMPHGRTGMKAASTVLSGYTGIIDSLLMKGVTNSSVCFDRLTENGYTGGLTSVKDYIAAHKVLYRLRGSLWLRRVIVGDVTVLLQENPIRWTGGSWKSKTRTEILIGLPVLQ